MNGFGELSVKQRDRPRRAAPDRGSTRPRRTSRGRDSDLAQVHELTDAADARRLVDYWTDMGATSLKAYMHITRDELKAAIDEGHKRGMKLDRPSLLGHVSRSRGARHRQPRARLLRGHRFRRRQEAGRLPRAGRRSGVDRRARHGGRAVQVAHQRARRAARRADVDAHGVRDVHAGTAGTAGARRARPELREQFEHALQGRADEPAVELRRRSSRRSAQLEIDFFRAGGLLVAGTDPTGGGGVIPGYSDQRAARAARRGRAHAARGDQGRHAERRDLPRPRGSSRLDRRGQAGRPRRDRRRSVGEHRGHSQGLTRVQARRRLRPGEADRVGEREGRVVLTK